MGYSPWGHKESDAAEVTEHAICTLPCNIMLVSLVVC